MSLEIQVPEDLPRDCNYKYMKKQIVVIHGGDTFETYEEYISFLKNFPIDFERIKAGTKNWKQTLQERLGDKYEVIVPSMPNKTNARFFEWKIWFEKFIPFLEKEVVLIGHSLGGTFLAKYLSENEFPKKIRATFLVAAPFDNKDSGESLVDFALPALLAGGPANVSMLEKQGGKVVLYYSEDDRVVPFAEFEKYKNALPGAVARVFTDRGHFNQEEFPELVYDISSGSST